MVWGFAVHQFASESDSKTRGCESEAYPSHITFMETDHEIISTAILTLPLIHKNQILKVAP